MTLFSEHLYLGLCFFFIDRLALAELSREDGWAELEEHTGKA